MISTKHIISDLKDVPREWVFENYLNLKEKLTGQDVKILSAFNSKDKVPSMCIYTDTISGYYKFKDFSSGIQGDSIELVKALYNMPTRANAVNKILSDYEDFLANNTFFEKREFKIHDKFKVVDHEIRHWNTIDQQYWTKFKIGSKLLEHYNVSPLQYFTMKKKDIDGNILLFKFERPYTYGYFRNDGTLYKIYQPKNKKSKFIKVSDYIQGSEQVNFDCKYLILTKSLKDIMSFKTLGIGNAEAIAPDSENTVISEGIMKKYMYKYSKIIVLFDNDEPGLEASKAYQKRYGFDYLILPFEKDISDTVKARGVQETRNIVFNLIKSKL